MSEILISEICKRMGVEYIGHPVNIDALYLMPRKTEKKMLLTYATSDAYAEDVKKNSKIKCIVINRKDMSAYEQDGIVLILSDNAEKTFYDIHDFLIDHTQFYNDFDYPKRIGNDCAISDGAIIEEGVIIGDRVQIGHNTVIKKGTVIEDDVIIGSNASIGSDGFQIIRSNGHNRHIRHCGGVYIGKEAAIGDNSVVNKSLFEGYTYIGQNAEIDNLCNIAHNCYIAEGAVITAAVTLCGSTVIEKEAWVGMNSTILNKVTVGKNSLIGIGSVVTRDVMANTLTYGVPAKKRRDI